MTPEAYAKIINQRIKKQAETSERVKRLYEYTEAEIEGEDWIRYYINDYREYIGPHLHDYRIWIVPHSNDFEVIKLLDQGRYFQKTFTKLPTAQRAARLAAFDLNSDWINHPSYIADLEYRNTNSADYMQALLRFIRQSCVSLLRTGSLA